MKRANSGCVLVSKNGEPIGILTEWDILSRVVAEGLDVHATRVKAVMSSPLLFIQGDTKVGSAISLMTQKGFRRLAVKSGDKLIGFVSLTQVMGNRRESSSVLPMIEPPHGSMCPYCNSVLESGEALSKHIDQVHIRSELLHAAREKWET